jgi:D-beta-D-heptose 7-phosphate kinase/D-beta-D-heptose 1-phosphate adenosyltransferase
MAENKSGLAPKNLLTLYYHDIFEYPLTLMELIKWEPGKIATKLKFEIPAYEFKSGYFYLKGKEGLILKRTFRKRSSVAKIKIARKAASVLKTIPQLKMVAITGATAMLNAKGESDIDLLLIAEKGKLWTTRLISLLTLKILGIPVRRFGEERQKDKLCLNMWLDESSLSWPEAERNIYTAHEIAQIIPILNKDKTYEIFLERNKWIKDYWPNSVKIPKKINKIKTKKGINIFEYIFRNLQYLYMRKKISREVVRQNKAIFHPIDWTEKVLSYFKPQ